MKPILLASLAALALWISINAAAFLNMDATLDRDTVVAIATEIGDRDEMSWYHTQRRASSALARALVLRNLESFGPNEASEDGADIMATLATSIVSAEVHANWPKFGRLKTFARRLFEEGLSADEMLLSGVSAAAPQSVEFALIYGANPNQTVSIRRLNQMGIYTLFDLCRMNVKRGFPDAPKILALLSAATASVTPWGPHPGSHMLSKNDPITPCNDRRAAATPFVEQALRQPRPLI